MKHIQISISHQTLTLLDDNNVLEQFKISTAKNGTGQQEGSEKTPLGKHRICQKIGEGMPINTVFKGRVPTGEVFDADIDKDWILTRILWLEGLEPGLNQGGNVDSKSRYIYIHGCPDQYPMGVPLSHGCIRMRNDEVISLFDQIEENIVVQID